MKLFTVLTIFQVTSSFCPINRFSQSKGVSQTVVLSAENGSPSYEKADAILSKSDHIAKDSVMLHIDSNAEVDYKPGHVIALEIEGVSDDVKTKEDTRKNEGWMRAPYTISRATEHSFEILIKVVGDKSKKFAFSPPGTPVRFGGKFHVPIIDGIDKETTKRVVFISTGVGVGPCIGAIELGLKETDFPPMELYPSFRMSDEIVCSNYLDTLVDNNPGKLKWKPIVTTEIGRISTKEENVKIVSSSNGSLSVKDTHYHLIGNGQMVNEWKQGLAKAGVPDDMVTVESYFNHKEEANMNAVNNIADVISASCCATVN